MGVPNPKSELYDKLIKIHPNVERKGKTMPYTSMNGHMFSFLNKDGKMGIRLSKQELEKFLIQFRTKLMIQHGRTMKEYAEVPEALLSDTKRLSLYLLKSLEYVSGLKPKPSKKKK